MNTPSRLPNLFMVGAAKSGTSSMWHYLTQHPEIYQSEIKEPHFYSLPFFQWPVIGCADPRFNGSAPPNLDGDVYADYYRGAGQERYVLDGSTSYLYYDQTAERIREACPDAKIIIVLRNPVERAFSAFTYRKSQLMEALTFEEALEAEDERIQDNYHFIWHYRRAGRYYQSVKHYLEVFGRENVCVVLLDDIKRDLQKTMDDLFRFLNLEPVPVKKEVMNRSGDIRHQRLYRFVYWILKSQGVLKKIIKRLSSKSLRKMVGRRVQYMFFKKAAMDLGTRRSLTAYYRDDILRLQDLLGRDLSIWLEPTNVEGKSGQNEEDTVE